MSGKSKAPAPGQRSLLTFFRPLPTTNNENEIQNAIDRKAPEQPTKPQATPTPRNDPLENEIDHPVAEPTPVAIQAGSSSPGPHEDQTRQVAEQEQPCSSPLDSLDAEEPPQPEAIENIEENDVAAMEVEQEDSEEQPPRPTKQAAAPQPTAATEYEQERAERIRRNMEVMKSLGLGKGQPLFSEPKPRSKPVTKRKLPAVVAPSGGPVRRSSRQRGGGPAVNDAAVVQHNQVEEEEEEEIELQYDASTVQRYVCSILSSSESSSKLTSKGPPTGAKITGFARRRGLLVDSTLTKGYSIDWRPGLVVSAGKDGRAAVWGTKQLEQGLPEQNERQESGNDEEQEQEEPEIEPLLSHKLHKSWISDVQFLSSTSTATAEQSQQQPLLLLSAANDGTVCLWDIAQTVSRPVDESSSHKKKAPSEPRSVFKATNIHASGIFSAHEQAGWVLTGSKDRSVVVSQIQNSGSLSVVTTYEDLHDGVVKCVRWQPTCSGVPVQSADSATQSSVAFLFASCGNDRAVKISDTRTGNVEITMEGEGWHDTAVNCVRFNPWQNNMVLSASNDPALLLHDLRSPGKPLFSFTGHSLESRINSIYQPCFVWGASSPHIVTGNERNRSLSLYCCTTGNTISRGTVDMPIGATFSAGGTADGKLWCTSNKSVALFSPTWSSEDTD